MGQREGACLLGAYSAGLPLNQEGPGSVLVDAAIELRSEVEKDWPLSGGGSVIVLSF